MPAISYSKNIHMHIPRVIALTGEPGSGKDHVASMLAMLGYQRLSYGDLVRKALIKSISQGDYPTDPRQKRKVVEEPWEVVLERIKFPVHEWFCVRYGNNGHENSLDTIKYIVNIKPTTPEVRVLLQWFGTEYGRDLIDRDHWAHVSMEKYTELIYRGPVVITDYRFPNENIWDKMHQRALIIRMVRVTDKANAVGVLSHRSELESKNLPSHVTLHNVEQAMLPKLLMDLMRYPFYVSRMKITLSEAWLSSGELIAATVPSPQAGLTFHTAEMDAIYPLKRRKDPKTVCQPDQAFLDRVKAARESRKQPRTETDE